MTRRTWAWPLPTGETLVAKIDPSSSTESVFLGPRLVSRAPHGSKVDGHTIRLRSGATYRGASDVRVFFEEDACRVEIDGQVLDASSSLTSAADEALIRGFKRRQYVGAVLAAGAAVLFVWRIGVNGLGEHSRAATPWDLAAFAGMATTIVYVLLALRCPACGALMKDGDGVALAPKACPRCDQPLR